MCGIFGYIGDNKNPLHACLDGLAQLEYRGYDSTGIAGIQDGHLIVCKKEGKLANLQNILTLKTLEVAIGHTRWATHGKVNDLNAHPHLDTMHSLAIVHNGIIENYDALKAQLKNEGAAFVTETDSEVIAHLIAKHYEGDLLKAVQTALPFLHGSYAIALIHKDHPDQIIAAAHHCPLAIGTNDAQTESIISSDPNALVGGFLKILFLRNAEIARIEKGNVQVFDSHGNLIVKTQERLECAAKAPSKDGFEHFLLKEIFEQPITIRKAMLGRFSSETAKVEFDDLKITAEEARNYKQVWFLGCGTSSLAGSIGAMYLEETAKIPAFSEIASEARYRTELIGPETLIIAISQSGETADTLTAMRAFKAKGCRTIAICNVKNSTLTREADYSIDLQAGPEISVCSSKAFTSQIAILALFALHLANLRNTTSAEALDLARAMPFIANQIQTVLEKAPQLEKIAKKYAHFDDFFFMGRRYMFTTCLEAALKLKEISYVNANGYAGGELKHGPIALISPTFPVICFCANKKTEEKIISNLMEVKARGAPIVAFAPDSMTQIHSIADDLFTLPTTIDPLAPFASAVAGQLFAYYIAKERGCDIDRPRHLAKSVTVE